MSTDSRRTSAARSRRSRAWLALSLGLLLVGAGSGAETVNRIVATIDGDPVTLYDVNQFAAADVRLRQAPQVEQAMVLETLITKRLIDKEVEAKGLAISDEDIDHYVEGIRQRNQLTEEQLEMALAQQNTTLDAYRKQVREELLRAQLISREIRGKVNVTPEDVQRYYEAHLDEYQTPEQISVSHIVLQVAADAPPAQVAAVTERANEIHAQLEGGADFAELAKRVSEDSAASSGGKLGDFKPGDMLEPLENAVTPLEPGEFSEPVRSPIGVHIVRLDDRATAGQEPIEGLAEEIKETLYNAALEERYNRWLREDLRKLHHVEIRP